MGMTTVHGAPCAESRAELCMQPGPLAAQWALQEGVQELYHRYLHQSGAVAPASLACGRVMTTSPDAGGQAPSTQHPPAVACVEEQFACALRIDSYSSRKCHGWLGAVWARALHNATTAGRNKRRRKTCPCRQATPLLPGFRVPAHGNVPLPSLSSGTELLGTA